MGEHPRDELSAFLDGALDEDTARWIEAHVLVCRACADELDAVRDARRSLRYLPAVEPPAGFLEALLADAGAPRRGDHRGWWLGNAAAAAVIGLALVSVSSGKAAQAVTPSVATAVARHSATVSAVSAGADTAVSAPARAKSLSKYVAPADLEGYRLVDAYDMPTGVQLLYEKGSAGMSVFEQEGSAPAHVTSYAGHVVEVVSRAGLVVTVVGDDAADVHSAAARLRPQPSVAHRCGDVLEGLSPVG